MQKLLSLLIAVGGAILTVDTLKFIVGRVRPSDLAIAIESSPSFPSAHAAIATSLYFFLGYLALRRGDIKGKSLFIFLSVIAILVGFSRVYIGVHYFSDVVAGWLVGLLWIFISSKLIVSFARRIGGGIYKKQ